MTKTKKIAAAVTSCALLGALALGGTMAYLTDSEKQTNEFTFGKVEIDLVESTFAGKATIDSDKATYNDKLVPYAIADKDPTVHNTGDESAVVFVKVVVPTETVTPVNETGTKGTEASTELFKLLYGNSNTEIVGSGSPTTTTTNSNWTLIQYDATNHAYIFGYTAVLAKDSATTTSPFDKVQLINMTDDSYETVAGEEYDKTQSINVYAYGIQATGLNNITGVDTSDGLSATELGTIWSAYTTQNGTGDPSDEANTNGNKDLKGDALGGE